MQKKKEKKKKDLIYGAIINIAFLYFFSITFLKILSFSIVQEKKGEDKKEIEQMMRIHMKKAIGGVRNPASSKIKHLFSTSNALPPFSSKG